MSEDEDEDLGQYKWNFRNQNVKENLSGYYIYAIISDKDPTKAKEESEIKEKALRSRGRLVVKYPPTIKLISPMLQGSRAIDEYTVSWHTEDIDNNDIKVSLYYHTLEDDARIIIGEVSDNTVQSGILTTNYQTSAGLGSYSWDIESFESANEFGLNGSYFIYAKATDGSGNEAGFTGAIPGSIGNLSNLERLYLNGNKLTSIPASIGSLQNLIELDLNNNELSGNIPESI